MIQMGVFTVNFCIGLFSLFQSEDLLILHRIERRPKADRFFEIYFHVELQRVVCQKEDDFL